MLHQGELEDLDLLLRPSGRDSIVPEGAAAADVVEDLAFSLFVIPVLKLGIRDACCHKLN